ncbi:MAG: selenocysteine lyase/cysteine desulfurase [Cognaticolwellia sp.]|jgi:selenocysteine lyase/cysteine desulfurase
MRQQTTVNLSQHFQQFRKNTIGVDQFFKTPFGKKQMIYVDWTASGRLYRPIEDALLNQFAPFVGNTHTETNITGTSMTVAYHTAKEIIKKHVNANEEDILIMTGSGMTGAVNKFQRLLGLKDPSRFATANDRPVIFVSNLEHHSNDISWRETIADIETIRLCPEGNIDTNHLKELLVQYKNRPYKIAAITACSNVTGIQTPYPKIAKLMHKNGGWCFVDFACSAPYVEIDMHPKNNLKDLDAVYFSMHKFLGGPGTPGALLFNKRFYQNKIPDNPGGGTVQWVNPWGEQQYINALTPNGIEAREDGGTPPFLQTIKSALCIKLKEKMNSKLMMQRDEELLEIIFKQLENIPNLHILAPTIKKRLGVVSFNIDGLHYNLGVKLLNDYFGIQVRGGCACAGPYGHYLLDITENRSNKIWKQIDVGNLSVKPGWIRLSIHPILTNEEVEYTLESIKDLANNFLTWQHDYQYNPITNEFKHRLVDEDKEQHDRINEWFEI